MYKRTLLLLAAVCLSLVAQDGISLVSQSSLRGVVPGEKPGAVSRSRALIPTNVKVYALRVEFQVDEDANTTGNGLFLRENQQAHPKPIINEDVQDFEWYADGKTYPYDNLPHDATYLSQHLDYLTSYFSTVSNGTLQLEYELFPSGAHEAYQVPLRMALYSPGTKRDDEKYTDYYYRRTEALMKFIRDAMIEFDTTSSIASPFDKLVMDDEGHLYEVDTTSSDSTLVVLLLMHAGASGLTDNNTGNSPSDLQDIFINSNHFFYFQDLFNGNVIDTPVVGVKVGGLSGDIVISELMMTSETSNQDSTNWGINGIMVNQLARQIGLPDLQNNSAGESHIGGFGIMDFAGYSRAQGFIPPYPSAWTRKYAGWDTPIVVDSADSVIIDALGVAGGNTLYQIPINQNEYWLIENRQRNRTTTDMFLYDTTDGTPHISGVNLSMALDSVTPNRGVVISALSQDVGIQASGGIIWHIDERVIRDRFDFNAVNADQKFRGVALEEADGIVEIGYTFQSIGGSVSSYGGGEDLFPHTATHSGNTIVRTIRSDTRPSTQANDGGHTFKQITINPPATIIGTEKYLYRRAEDTKYEQYFVNNYRTNTLLLSVSQEQDLPSPLPGWPVSLSDSGFFDPIYYNQHLYLLDAGGNIFILNDSAKTQDSSLTYVNKNGDSIAVSYSINTPYTLPILIGDRIAFPVSDTLFHRILANTPKEIVSLQDTATSNMVGYSDSSWIIGTSAGSVEFGVGALHQGTLGLDTSAIVRLAQFGEDGSTQLFSAISSNGNVIIFDSSKIITQFELSSVTSEGVAPPYSLAVGNLDGDTTTEVIVTDAKQGLWLLQASLTGEDLEPHPDAIGFPNDWAGYFRSDTGRTTIPLNGAAPTLSDINNDGYIEILLPGTNGVYAFNHTGVLLDGWPAQLNRPEWYLRKSITSSAITLHDADNQPFMLMASPTGDETSFYITKADTIDTTTNTIYFLDYLNELDSLTDQEDSTIDSTIASPDSALAILYAPGGLIDGRSADGTRPFELQKTSNAGTIEYSTWPLTVGGPISTAPLAISNTSGTRIFAISDEGTAYQWHFDSTLLKIDPTGWPMTGGSPQRGFYRAPSSGIVTSASNLSNFYSYPNPVKFTGDYTPTVRFRYELGPNASKVTLSIFTMNGHLLFKDKNLPTHEGLNEYLLARLDAYGSAVYQCRLSVTINGAETAKYWKMVVLRGAQK